MTRKDYELIAKALRDSIRDRATLANAALMFAADLGREDPRFDENRFVAACLSPVDSPVSGGA